jgi:hypothetical protein
MKSTPDQDKHVEGPENPMESNGEFEMAQRWRKYKVVNTVLIPSNKI